MPVNFVVDDRYQLSAFSNRLFTAYDPWAINLKNRKLTVFKVIKEVSKINQTKFKQVVTLKIKGCAKTQAKFCYIGIV